jgi:hypothetical protein
MNLPPGLMEIIDYGWPDALWVAGEARADDAYTIWILNIDSTYTEWLASLSWDGRWTLSPVRGPWHTAETGRKRSEDGWQIHPELTRE